MFNLDKVKDQLAKYSNKLSIGILGSVAAIVPQQPNHKIDKLKKLLFLLQKKMKVRLTYL